MDWLSDSQWLAWVAVAIVAGVAEVASLNLIFAMIAAGALLAGLVAYVTGNVVLAVLMFAVSSGLLLVGARPLLLRYAGRAVPSAPMHVAALVGRTAVVISEVTAGDGRIKLGGEIWSARTDGAQGSLEAGSTVLVLRIDGATAVVTSTPALPGADAPPG